MAKKSKTTPSVRPGHLDQIEPPSPIAVTRSRRKSKAANFRHDGCGDANAQCVWALACNCLQQVEFSNGTMTLAHGRGFGLKSWTRTAAAGTLFIFSSFSFASASSPIFCSDGLFYTLVAYVSLTVLAAVVIATFVLGNSEYGAELMRWLERQGVSMNHKMHNFSESFARAVPPTAELNSWYIDEKDLVRIACIGQGNMGQVWFAKWNGTRVAVKTMLGNWEKDESMVERFKDEINLMCTLVSFPVQITGVCAR